MSSRDPMDRRASAAPRAPRTRAAKAGAPADVPGPPSGGAAAIDRSRFVPLYFQIAEILKDRIEAATWQAGDRFPSERELIEEFGVSRTAIRPALQLLESDGELVRIKGKGTFVAPPKTALAVQGLARLLSRPLPGDTTVRILAVTERRPEPNVREVLGLGRRRMRNVTALATRGGVPMFLCDSFSSVDELPWLGELATGAAISAADTPRGRRGAVALAPAAIQIETASLSHWEAEQLQAAAGGGCYLVRCIEHAAARGGTARAVELARLVYRSDKVRLELRAARD
jgi:GntR family transcriptional regulator